ncbi:hypothetical protein DFP94_1011061 [Fontibacillus phaseoli]|uniref:Uncharacterized protein n=1 Tax=Fontibacillus phaseoli TaxID=1416533 RepID=A0A369BPC1_9BACL|nr:hypothetical protein DFP94_1011061 [Fontibacillus phaseoli]
MKTRLVKIVYAGIHPCMQDMDHYSKVEYKGKDENDEQ